MSDILLLRPEMITRDVLDILNVLTPTNKLSLGEARNIIILQLKVNHYTYCLYEDGIPLAIGSFIILSKLGRNGSRSALIEDVAVREGEQGKGYGKKLVKFLIKKAKAYNVYKIFLNCSDSNVEFYKKCGFKMAGAQMKIELA